MDQAVNEVLTEHQVFVDFGFLTYTERSQILQSVIKRSILLGAGTRKSHNVIKSAYQIAGDLSPNSSDEFINWDHYFNAFKGSI